MKINSHNEWDRLREIIVGKPRSMASLVFPHSVDDRTKEKAFELARQAYPKWLSEEMHEDLEELCDVLKENGARVLRPNDSEVNKVFSTPNWTAVGGDCYNMRDHHLVVGNTVIESPTPNRDRYYEAMGLYDIWYQYFKEGFRWISAPNAKLTGDYEIPFHDVGREFDKVLFTLAENEILFEAANTVRMGRDLLYLVSKSGNYLGAKWLQSVLGEEYTVHSTDKIYRSSHIDSTVLCLKPGLVLLNSFRVNADNCPKVLRKWEKIYFNDIVSYPKEIVDFQRNVRNGLHKKLLKLGVKNGLGDMSSEWIGMNILSVNPETVIVDKRQTNLIKALEKRGLTVLPISFRHSYFNGGIHCSTLDTVRDSKLERYVECFDES